MELLQEVLQALIYAVITGASVVIVKKILTFLNKKIDEAQVNTELKNYDKVNKVIDEAQDIIYKIVVTTNQTFVDALKKEGKFDDESAKHAKETAVAKAKELMSAEAIKAVEDIYGSLDLYLDVTIESVVNQLKKYN